MSLHPPQDCLPLGVGKGTHIKGAIVDKNARIGKFCKIVNAEGIQVRLRCAHVFASLGMPLAGCSKINHTRTFCVVVNAECSQVAR